jgi:hypothetical protein
MTPRLIQLARSTILVISLLSIARTSQGAEAAWRPLHLVAEGKIDPAWVHVGYGGFAVDD